MQRGHPTQRTLTAHVARKAQKLKQPATLEVRAIIQQLRFLFRLPPHVSPSVDLMSIAALEDATIKLVPHLSLTNHLHICDLWFLSDYELRHRKPILTLLRKSSTTEMVDDCRRGYFSRDEVLQLLWYCVKYEPTDVDTIVQPLLSIIDKDTERAALTWHDVEILSYVAFMLKLPISHSLSGKMLAVTRQAINDDTTLHDIGQINMMLKFLRQNDAASAAKLPLKPLAMALIRRLQRDGHQEKPIEAVTAVAFLQFFAHAKIIDVNVFKLLIMSVVDLLENFAATTTEEDADSISLRELTRMPPFRRVRCKELSRLLLSIADVGVRVADLDAAEPPVSSSNIPTISVEILMPIFEEIRHRVGTGEYEQFHIEELVAAAFAVCMLNAADLRVNRPLISTVTSERFLDKVVRTVEHRDTRRRLYQILMYTNNAYRINLVDAKRSLLPKDFFYLTYEKSQRRQVLEQMYQILCETFPTANVVMGRCVPFIEVIDFQVHFKSSNCTVTVDILDESRCAQVLLSSNEEDAHWDKKKKSAAYRSSSLVPLGIVHMKRNYIAAKRRDVDVDAKMSSNNVPLPPPAAAVHFAEGEREQNLALNNNNRSSGNNVVAAGGEQSADFAHHQPAAAAAAAVATATRTRNNERTVRHILIDGASVRSIKHGQTRSEAKKHFQLAVYDVIMRAAAAPV